MNRPDCTSGLGRPMSMEPSGENSGNYSRPITPKEPWLLA